MVGRFTCNQSMIVWVAYWVRERQFLGLTLGVSYRLKRLRRRTALQRKEPVSADGSTHGEHHQTDVQSLWQRMCERRQYGDQLHAYDLN